MGARPTKWPPAYAWYSCLAARRSVIGAALWLPPICTVNDEIVGVDREAQQRKRERKVRRPGPSVPPGLLRPNGLGRPAHLFAAPCPAVSPCENPFPFAGLSRGRPPPNDRHREVALLIGGYSAQPLSQPGPLWVAVRLLRTESCAEFRHKWSGGPLFPPGGDCASIGGWR